MAAQRSNKNESALTNALATVFDAIRPSTRAEAEEELRTAGVDPDPVGQRTQQLAESMLSGHVAADATTRRIFTPSRAAWSLAAALLLCLVGWALMRDAKDGGLLQEYRERIQRGARAQRDQQVAGRLPRADKVPAVQPGAESEAPPPTAVTAPTPAAEALTSAQPGWSNEAVDVTIPLPSSELALGGLIPGGAIAAGTIVTARNLEGVGTSLPPGLQWAVRNGLQIRAEEPRTIVLPRAYREATERYAGQVKLAPDGASLQGYTAGLPFPAIDLNDSQAAIKIMWNYEYRPFATDDFEATDFELESGQLGENGARMTVDRRIVFAAFRRLYYNGRLYADPRPELPNSDGIRFRDSMHPLQEPFDLRGAGETSVRYNDIRKSDDTWVYVPEVRRVRRLSAAARSDSLWGQDIDPDSFFGFSGPVGGTTWRLLGESEIVGCMHAENRPVVWGSGSADFAFDDVWETRPVFVVESVSKLPHYAYSKRVLYIDKEAWVVLFSDIYNQAGELAKVWLNMFSVRGERIDNPAAVMIDVQRRHATRVAVPNARDPATTGWILNQGEISEDWFKIAHLIESGQ